MNEVFSLVEVQALKTKRQVTSSYHRIKSSLNKQPVKSWSSDSAVTEDLKILSKLKERGGPQRWLL